MNNAKWIPTSEAKPDCNTPVLTCDHRGNINVLTRILEGDHFYWTNLYVDFFDDIVVAWMPLPEPYVEIYSKGEQK